MLVERNREKLLNALIYFSENVLYLGKTKLFKLLNYLDFLHYQKTGRSVTGLRYYAWEKGPVPKDLQNELKRPSKDFNEHFYKKLEVFGGGKQRERLVARKKFNPSWFSPYELELMDMLAKKHFNDNAMDISESSHFETGPWHEVWEVRGDKQAEIPYDLVLLRRGNAEDTEVMEIAKEYRELPHP